MQRCRSMATLVTCFWVLSITGIQSSDLLPMIAEGESPSSVWERLSANPLELSERSAPDGYSAEVISLEGGVKRRRDILDEYAGQRLQAGGPEGYIMYFYENDGGVELHDGEFVVKKDGQKPDWKCILNRPMQRADTKQPVEWDRRTRSYLRPVGDGRYCRLSLRTPSDSERWNCGWQHVTAWDSDGSCIVEHRRVVIGANGEHRLRADRVGWIPEWVENSKGQDQQKQSELLFGKIVAREMIYGKLGIGKNYWRGTELIGVMEAFHDLSTEPPKSENSSAFRNAVSDYFRKTQLEIPFWMSDSSDGAFSYGTSQITMDDPAMRYWRSELVTGSVFLNLLYDFSLANILRNNALSLSERLAACETIGEFGRPARLFEPIGLIEDRDLCETVLFSRWQHSIQDRHVLACKNYLKSGDRDPACSMILVDSLIRVDELPLIPSKLLDDWWSNRVSLQKLPASPARKEVETWDTICMTSRSPSGRRFLLKKFESDSSSGVRIAIRKCLRLRAESTVRTKRWDFMTEDECKQILALPEPPVPGKNADGGPARAFPVDE